MHFNDICDSHPAPSDTDYVYVFEATVAIVGCPHELPVRRDPLARQPPMPTVTPIATTSRAWPPAQDAGNSPGNLLCGLLVPRPGSSWRKR